MKLYRVDAVHENERGGYHGELTRFARFELDAKVLAAITPAYAGWLVDLCEIELPPGCESKTVDRLCSAIWPNVPLEQLLDLATVRTSTVAEAEQRLEEILSTRHETLAAKPQARGTRG